jgi:hypothetical protein
MPERLFGGSPTLPLKLEPSKCSLEDIYRRAQWLKELYSALNRVTRIVSDLKTLEVDQSLLDLQQKQS